MGSDGSGSGGMRVRRALLRRAAAMGLLAAAGGRGLAAPTRARTLTWAIVDWAPLFVFDPARPPTQAAELGDGVADVAMAELIARLPQYEHRFEPVSGRRLSRALNSEREFCFAALLKTPERAQRYHLLPWSAMPPPVLVARAGLAARLPEGELSLADLLRRDDLRGALEARRSYGAGPDRLLAEARPGLVREEVGAPGQLLRLVALGRYDYTLEYPLAVEQQQRSRGLAGEAGLALRPLLEARDWPVLHVACRRGPTGLETAQALAQAISEAARSRAGLREAVPRWLPPGQRAAARARLEPLFEQLAAAPTRVE